jgi:hypothetical protein
LAYVLISAVEGKQLIPVEMASKLPIFGTKSIDVEYWKEVVDGMEEAFNVAIRNMAAQPILLTNSRI